jgi:hypothetical protein
MSYIVIPPTPLENFSPLPAVGMPSFPGDALRWVNNWTEVWIPGLNAMADDISHNATVAATAATDAAGLATDMQAIAAAVVSGASARLWASGNDYVAATPTTPADVVLDPDDVSAAYRCKTSIVGSTVNPRLDPTHWVRLTGLSTVVQEAFLDIGGGSNLDLSVAAAFRKEITGSTTLTVSNPAPVGRVTSGVLRLVNGGAHAVTFWPGTQWSGGVVPALTASGSDVIGFYTDDGGSTYTMTLIASNPA